MSRANYLPLKNCPSCGTEIGDKNIGLRDYQQLTSLLPGKVGMMDYDAVLHQARTGRKLILEFKKPGQKLEMAQRITFTDEVKHGADVWVIWEKSGGLVDATAINKAGQMPFMEKGIPVARLARLLADWWELGWREVA